MSQLRGHRRGKILCVQALGYWEQVPGADIWRTRRNMRRFWFSFMPFIMRRNDVHPQNRKYIVAWPPEEDEQRLQVTCTEHFVKFANAVFEICKWTDKRTGKQTDRQANMIQTLWSQYFIPNNYTVVGSGCLQWNRKERKSIYIAPFIPCIVSKRSDMDHTFLSANYTMPAFPL